MTLFDAIRERVTARDAAEMYGLHFGHNRRARCPWHDDDNPDLAFYPNGTCYCFACRGGGDAIALTAQIFGLSMIEAAKKLNSDFRLGVDAGKPVPVIVRKQIEQRRQERKKAAEEKRREWSFLCDVKHEAERQIDAVVSKLKTDELERAWNDPQFIRALLYRSRAEIDLERIWEGVTRNG